MKRVLLGGAAVVLGFGCAAPPQAGDPRLTPGPVRKEYLLAPALRLRPVAVGGHRVPEGPLTGAAARLARYTGRLVLLEDASEVAPDGDSEDAMGVVLAAAARDRPLEPGTILVVPVGGVGVTGYQTWRGGGEGEPARTPIVVVLPETIARRAGFFVKSDRLWEWTISHEIGHVLGVPASNSHAWWVPGLGGNHCTHPECVMYTGFDWRVLWTGIVRGWPMEFCSVCAGELEAAEREAAGIAPEAGIAPVGAAQPSGQEPP